MYDLDKLFDLMDKARSGYDAHAKEAWKKEGLRVARALGKELQGPVKVRFNAGGVAVSGEVYLDAPGLKLWFEAGIGSEYGVYREEYERGPRRSRFMGQNRGITRRATFEALVESTRATQQRGIEMMQAEAS